MSRVRLIAAGAAVIALLALLPASASAEGRCGELATRPWCDTSLTPDERADLLLSAMTSDEKISLLGGDELGGVAGGEGTHTGTSDGIERLGIPTIYFSDGPAGVRSGMATAMPSPIAIGASFDPQNAARDAGVIADEEIKKGNDIVFAPTVDIVRTPLAGRVFEALGGEDPYLSSQLAVPWIKTVQAKGLIANVKHYAGNNQEGTGPAANEARPGNFAVSLGGLATEGNRMRINARIDQRTLRELYLPMFEAAVKKADVASVMCAYNQINGHFACENKSLLEDILRGDWGFTGMTIADYNAAHDAGASLIDGLDVEPWPGIVYGPNSVNAALAKGPATMTDVDRHVLRYLRTLFAYGAMDRPAYEPNEAAIDQAAHATKSGRVAQEGMVLLRNDGLLPLKRKQLDSIAVIGPGADAYLTGGGSSEIKPFAFTSPLDGITQVAGTGVTVTGDDGTDVERAAQLAASSDVAIVVPVSYSTEGVDRTCLTFECPPVYGDQDTLIRAVAAANPKTAVVMESGGPVLTPWSKQVGAVVEAWYPGSAAGSAMARLLFGKVDASGRLPVTFPRSEAQLPTAGDPNAYPGVGDIVDYDEGLLVGYRHYDANGIKPAYPFGHGLSYTSFRFSDLRVSPSGKTASVDVANTGDRRGIAVPQVYLSLPSHPGVAQPPKKLAGFDRVALRPGQSQRVRFHLTSRTFSYWDEQAHGWKVVPGCAQVLVGRDSRHTPLKAPIGLDGACD
jgi:beta-glucosidase